VPANLNSWLPENLGCWLLRVQYGRPPIIDKYSSWVGKTCEKCGKGKYQWVKPSTLKAIELAIFMDTSDLFKCDNPLCGYEIHAGMGAYRKYVLRSPGDHTLTPERFDEK
jgi:hypothetical protein